MRDFLSISSGKTPVSRQVTETAFRSGHSLMKKAIFVLFSRMIRLIYERYSPPKVSPVRSPADFPQCFSQENTYSASQQALHLEGQNLNSRIFHAQKSKCFKENTRLGTLMIRISDAIPLGKSVSRPKTKRKSSHKRIRPKRRESFTELNVFSGKKSNHSRD